MQSNGEINITDYKRYLLGSLSPPESEAFDLQIIADEKLLWAESELMERQYWIRNDGKTLFQVKWIYQKTFI
jgi:hypothetical protein